MEVLLRVGCLPYAVGNPNSIRWTTISYARIHHCRLKNFNPSSIARFLDPTIKLNLHISRIDFYRYSPFNFIIENLGLRNVLFLM